MGSRRICELNTLRCNRLRSEGLELRLRNGFTCVLCEGFIHEIVEKGTRLLTDRWMQQKCLLSSSQTPLLKASPEMKGFQAPDLQARSRSGSRLGHVPGSFDWVTGTAPRCTRDCAQVAELSLPLLYFSNKKKSNFNKACSIKLSTLITVRDFTHASSVLVV